MEAIYIFWLRQIKRYFRSKSRLVGSLAQPALLLMALGFGFGPIFEKAGGGNYIAFIVPGIITQTILYTAMFAGIDLIWDRQFGFLREMLAAPVSRFSIIIGRTLGTATIAAAQGLIVLFLSLFLGFRPFAIGRLFFSIGFMFLIAFLFTVFGTALASVIDDVQGFQLIVSFFLLPMFFLSGALFPLDGFPGPLRMVASFNPLTYGIDALRSCLINISHFGLTWDLTVLGLLTIAFLWLANYSFSKTQA